MTDQQDRPPLGHYLGAAGPAAHFTIHHNGSITQHVWTLVRPAQSWGGGSERRDTMLERALKLYTTFMATGTTGLLPHFVGPPGSGKSTTFQQLAELLGVKLHVVNVSRINPLGLEGLEMPDQDSSALRLLISEMWTKADEGDIYLFDEFLRGFPEVYNGLLDIFTSREVAGYALPRVFIVAASNSVATYDPALEDRLIHIPVADPRSNTRERERLAKLIVSELGLHPEVEDSMEMDSLLSNEVLPTFAVLDSYKKGGVRATDADVSGSSVRKLIAQAKLREVQSISLRELIAVNNEMAMRQQKPQYVLLTNGKKIPAGYESAARGIQGSDKLSPVQRENLEINLQLIEMEQAMTEQTEKEDEDGFLTDDA